HSVQPVPIETALAGRVGVWLSNLNLLRIGRRWGKTWGFGYHHALERYCILGCSGHRIPASRMSLRLLPCGPQVTRVTGVLWIFDWPLSIEVTLCWFDIRSLGMPRIHLPERGIFLAHL